MSNTALDPQQKRFSELRTFLNSKALQNQIAMVLPKHLTPERMIRVALSAASRNPSLLQCTQTSFAKAIIEASELGLEPGSMIGGVHLVPYRNNKRNCMEVQAIVDYRGLMDLARRSGEVKAFDAQVVCEKDKFEISYGTEKRLIHEPYWRGDRGPIRLAYAVASLSNGDIQFDWMTIEEIEQVRARSKAKDSGPWVTDFPEMCKKSVSRRLCKRLPRSTQLQHALEIEERAEFEPDSIDTEFISLGNSNEEQSEMKASQTEALKDELRQSGKAPSPSPAEQATEQKSGGMITKDQAKTLKDLAKQHGYTHHELERYAKGIYGVVLDQLPAAKLTEMSEHIATDDIGAWLMDTENAEEVKG